MWVSPNDLFLALLEISSPDLFLSASFPFQTAYSHLLLDAQPTHNMFLTEFIFLPKSVLSTRFSISAHYFYNHLKGEKWVWAAIIENGIIVQKQFIPLPFCGLYMPVPLTLTLAIWLLWPMECKQIWHMPHIVRRITSFRQLSPSSALSQEKIFPDRAESFKSRSRNGKIPSKVKPQQPTHSCAYIVNKK